MTFVSSDRPTSRQFAWLVTRDVSRTLGGGTAAVEVLRRSLAARGWLDQTAHGIAVAVSRLTPGTNVLAYCAAVGWEFDELRGSVIAVAAASTPSALVILALSAALVRLDRYRSIQALLAIGALAAAALVLSSAWHLVRPYLGRPARIRTAMLAALTIGLYALDWSPVRILLIAAVCGLALPPGERA